jgi:hypothetical protein
MLVAFAPEHLEDLSSARRLAVHATSLNPITRLRAAIKQFRGHQLTSFDLIKPLRPEVAIGGQRDASRGDLPMRARRQGRVISSVPAATSNTPARRPASIRPAQRRTIPSRSASTEITS